MSDSLKSFVEVGRRRSRRMVVLDLGLGIPVFVLMVCASILLWVLQGDIAKLREDFESRLGTRPRTRTGLVAIIDSLGTKGVQSREHLAAEAARRGRLSRAVRQDLTRESSIIVPKIIVPKNLEDIVLPPGALVTENYDTRLESVLRFTANDLVKTPLWKIHGLAPKVKDEVSRIVLVFSDTIIVAWSAEAAPETLIQDFGRKFLGHFCFAVTEGVYYRGAVAIGDFVTEDNQLMGPAVDEAYEWHDATDWAGVILSPTACFGYEGLTRDSRPKQAIWTKYPAPFKPHLQMQDIIPGGTWCLNWPPEFPGGRAGLLQTFSHHRVSLEAGPKLTNTLRFFDSLFPRRSPPGRR